jgi:GDP-L-fucose synthase
MQKKRLFIAGHRGMAGSAIRRHLEHQGKYELILRTRQELDLENQQAVEDFFAQEKPQVVVLAAARVGGIRANDIYSAEFFQQNLAIQNHVIHSAWKHGCERLLFLGSSCIYPKLAPQPMKEEALLTGLLEPTNEAYALAKIAGLKMCQHYRKQYGVLFHSLMPTNLYGPGDNYHPENSHVLPALIRRFHEAKEKQSPEVVVWGTGSPLREFLHVDDLAAAATFLLELENPPDWVNVGSGQEVSIKQLAEWVKEASGYQGELVWDHTKPDGTPRKLLDTTLLDNLGWRASIPLKEGIKSTYNDFLQDCARGVARL